MDIEVRVVKDCKHRCYRVDLNHGDKLRTVLHVGCNKQIARDHGNRVAHDLGVEMHYVVRKIRGPRLTKKSNR